MNQCLNPFGLNHECNVPVAKRGRKKKMRKLNHETLFESKDKSYEDELASDKEINTPLSQDESKNVIEEKKNNSKFVPQEITIFTNHKSEVYFGKFHPIESNILASGSNDGTVRIVNLTSKAEKVLSYSPNAGTDEDITSMEWSFSGDFLSTSSYDGNARLWDIAGKLVADQKLGKGPLLSVKWRPELKKDDLGKKIEGSPFNDPNKSWIASCGVDGSNKIWSPQLPNSKFKVHYHLKPASDLDWLDSNLFATASTDKTISIIDLRSSFCTKDEGKFQDDGRPVLVWKAHEDEVNCIKWHPNSDLGILASGSDDSTVRIWKLNTAYSYSAGYREISTSSNPMLSLEDHDDPVFLLKWAPKSNSLLATASSDKTVKLWDLNSNLSKPTTTINLDRKVVERKIIGQATLELKRHKNTVYCLDFSKDGKYIATGGFDNYVYVWNTSDGKLVKAFKGNGGIFDLNWSNVNANLLMATLSNHSVLVFDIRS